MRLLIVTHFSDEFSEDTAKFYEYFLKIVKLPENQISFYALETFIRGQKIEDVFGELVAKDSPLVIYYGGHGARDGWKLSGKYTALYKNIVPVLKGQKKPLIFLNDCCFGMALQDYLPQLNCRHLLLGLCPKTLEGYDSLVPATLKCWKESKPADPKQWVYRRNKLTSFALQKCADRLRRGENLDYLCYPRQTR
ncbi:MAG: hypothetical protein HYY86_03550 [Candidatus Harrisonbacteria bacterium]|nr:hypothetical protein [Candidatus Harrisonbacteria bacterium]